MIVGEYTVLTIGNPLRNLKYTVFGWRIHKLVVGEHTVVTIGNRLRNLRIHSFFVENKQVDRWRIHSFSYRKSLKEPQNTQYLGGEYPSRLSENTQLSL